MEGQRERRVEYRRILGGLTGLHIKSTIRLSRQLLTVKPISLKLLGCLGTTQSSHNLSPRWMTSTTTHLSQKMWSSTEPLKYWLTTATPWSTNYHHITDVPAIYWPHQTSWRRRMRLSNASSALHFLNALWNKVGRSRRAAEGDLQLSCPHQTSHIHGSGGCCLLYFQEEYLLQLQNKEVSRPHTHRALLSIYYICHVILKDENV